MKKHVICASAVLSVWGVFAGEIAFDGCRATWDETSLKVGNGRFTRVYGASGDQLVTSSFTAYGKEWIDGTRAVKAGGRLEVQARQARRSVVGAEGLVLEVTAGKVTRKLWVFPKLAGVLLEDPTVLDAAAAVAPDPRVGRYSTTFSDYSKTVMRGADVLPIAPVHLRVREFQLRDMTDVRAELLSEREWVLRETLIGSAPAVAVEDQQSAIGEGLVFLRLAPLQEVRPVRLPDYCIRDATKGRSQPQVAMLASGYPVAEVAYVGGEAGRIGALQDVQRALREYRPGRDGILLSNTWGDSNRDIRINADFMMAEVKAGGELGVDVIQIDDGWQKGKSHNSGVIKDRMKNGAWGNFRAADPNFWQPDPVRFPQGLGPIVAAAKERGMGFGLWFGPDSTDDCAAWEQDAETILDFYKNLGVRYFKIDALRMTRPLAFARELKMFDRLLNASKGDLTFDLDVTGGSPRPGYFGLADIGPLFVENRYWKTASYWPHLTLRAAWSLAKVIDPVRLRMEFLNPLHGKDVYPKSPLAPANYRGDTLFATVMNFSPLGWFEIFELAPSTVAEMKPLIARWKTERANVHGGLTVPVGAAPDGFAWTGFLTRGADGASAYALLFRELNGRADFSLDVTKVFAGLRFGTAEVIGGRGSAKMDGTGAVLSVDVPKKLDFVWVKLSAGAPYATVVEPLENEKWFGGILNDGAKQPYVTTDRPRDLAYENKGGTTSPFLVSTRGRYVWSDRPFVYAFTNGTLYVRSDVERVEPVVAGTTLKEAYLAAMAKHFPFDGKIPAELLFTKPQWNNWIEIAIQGMKQSSVDAYTEALAASGFPCGVFMMDGGWFSHMGSYKFYADDYPDPKGMFRRIREKGWKSMIWTAHFMSPDSREHKMLRAGKGYMIDGKDVLAYKKEPNRTYATGRKAVGVVWWWSGVSAVWDLTYKPGWDDYVETLEKFAAEYGIDGFKFDAGDPDRLYDNVRFHDPKKEAVDYAHDYARVGAERFPYNEYRCGFRTGGLPIMQRLHDQGHSWKSLAEIDASMIVGGLLGSPYVVADMVGGGLAGTYRPGSFFSEKLFVRLCAQQALHPMMQFSAAPWRYLSKENVELCKAFANLHVAFGPYILEQARHAAKTGEPIMRSMEYEFPHQGFETEMTQFMLGPKWLVAPVVREDDSATVRLPAGNWKDDLGEVHVGPKTLELTNVPLARLPRYERQQ